MIKKILIISVLTLTGSVYATNAANQDQKGVIQEGPELGQTATAEEVAALSINIFPDG